MKETKLKDGCQIKFYSSYNELDELPQDEVILLMSKEEFLKSIGLRYIESDKNEVFISINNIKILDKED